MDFVRMFVPPIKEDVLTFSDAKLSSSTPSVECGINRVDNANAAWIAKCARVLPLIVDSNFQSKYRTLAIGIPDCYVFTHWSLRCLILEVVTKFHESQLENMHTYKFTTHPLFENRVRAFTRFKGLNKPNPNLVRSRTWDVALNVVLKIEALSSPFDTFRYLLKREYRILDLLWCRHLNTTMDIDEMTGIPMIFEFVEVPNHEYNTQSKSNVSEIDIDGKLKRMNSPMGSNKLPTLAYLTMEKLGPNIGYLQQLVRIAHKPLQTFDMWTALKIFDQLLCRIMKVHRLGIVHNDICPENIYMGNGVAFDVVYLNNFKRAYILTENNKEGPTGLSNSCIGCNIRFASIAQLSRSASLMNPTDDIESAFYLLVSMLNADILPWDSVLRNSNSINTVKMNPTINDKSSDANGGAEASEGILQKILEMKKCFWNSSQALNVLINSSACIGKSNSLLSAGVISVIREIYYRVKDWRYAYSLKSGEESLLYCKKLSCPTSHAFRNFCELRKCALTYFKFADTSDFLNDITFRTKLDSQKERKMIPQQPWNYLVWCFNNIEIKPDNKHTVTHEN